MIRYDRVLQGWMFAHDSAFWTEDKVKAFLTAVPTVSIETLAAIFGIPGDAQRSSYKERCKKYKIPTFHLGAIYRQQPELTVEPHAEDWQFRMFPLDSAKVRVRDSIVSHAISVL